MVKVLILLVLLIDFGLSENVLNYRFINKNIIKETTKFGNERLNLKFYGRKNHFLPGVLAYDMNNSTFMKSISTHVLKAHALGSKSFNLTMKLQLPNMSIKRTHYCLFGMQYKEFYGRIIPYDVMKYFDAAITWSHRNLNFYLKMSTEQQDISRRSVFVSNDMLGVPITIQFLYDETHVKVNVNGENKYVEEHSNMIDFSNWHDKHSIYIGSLFNTEDTTPELQLFSYELHMKKMDSIHKVRRNFFSDEDHKQMKCVCADTEKSLEMSYCEHIFMKSHTITCNDFCKCGGETQPQKKRVEVKIKCRNYDNCGICDGDGSTCPIVDSKSNYQCYFNYTQCSIKSHYLNNLRLETDLLDLNYTIFLNVTVSNCDDIVTPILNCKNNNKLEWSFTTLNNTDPKCNTKFQKIGTATVGLKKMFECITGNKLKDINQLKHLSGIIRIKYTSNYDGYTIPCHFNIPSYIEKGKDHQGVILVSESSTSTMKVQTQQVLSYFKEDDLFITFNSCFKMDHKNSNLNNITVFGEDLELVDFTSCELKNESCCHLWKLRSTKNHFLKNEWFATDTLIGMNIGHTNLNHYLRLNTHMFYKQEESPNETKEKHLFEKPSDKSIKMCFYNQEEQLTSFKRFFVGDRIFVKMYIDQTNITLNCNKDYCPTNNGFLQIKKVNLCVFPRNSKDRKSCSDPDVEKYTLIDLLNTYPIGGKLWNSNIKQLSNCQNGVMFSFKPDVSILGKLIRQNLHMEVIWDTYKSGSSIFGFSTASGSGDSEDDDPYFNKENFKVDCKSSGVWNSLKKECASQTSSFINSASNAFSNWWTWIFLILFIITIFSVLRCAYHTHVAAEDHLNEIKNLPREKSSQLITNAINFEEFNDNHNFRNKDKFE